MADDGGRRGWRAGRKRWGAFVAVVLATLLTPVLTSLVQAAPDQTGQWGPVLDWGIQGKHMALMPTGKVMVFSTGQNARVWDPGTGSFELTPATFGDLHCAGHSTLADGRFIVLGGQLGSPHIGINVTAIFDPFAQTWTEGPAMRFERWYASVTTLADGRVLATSGDDGNGKRVTVPEVFDPTTNSWTDLPARSQALYPMMYVLPDERAYEAGPGSGTALLSLAGTPAWTPGPSNAYSTSGYSESSVMYAPGKILRAGGGDPAIKRASVIDMNATTPAWSDTSPMSFARRRMNLVLLADGQVLAIGGTARSDSAADAVLAAEIWNPDTGQWTTLASMAEARMYHSSAVLLADGRVVVSGGEADGRLRAQIYEPPYLHSGNRPVITAAPSTIGWGTGFRIETPQASTITGVALIRTGASTHAWDQNQRYVPLSFTASGDGLDVSAPAGGGAAPPGYYQLVIENSAGVPSVASFVRVGDAGQLSPGHIAGTVTDAATGQPVEGATVGYGGGTTASGVDGSYRLDGVAPGTHTVTVTAPGYATSTSPVTVTAGTTSTLDAALVQPGTLSGTVTDAGTGAAISGAVVSAGGASTTTGADGAYRLPDLPAGPTTVQASMTGYDSASTPTTVTAGGAGTVDLSLARTSTYITGQVYDAGTPDHVPVAGATVTASGVPGAATTDDIGNYRIVAPVGTYTVTASAPGCDPAGGTAVVTAGAYATVDLGLPRPPPTPPPPTESPIKHVTFDNGLTHPTSGVDKTSGAVALETAAPLQGTGSARITGSGYLEENVDPTDTFFLYCLLQLTTRPTGDDRIIQLSNSGTTVGNLQVRAGGQLRLRVGSTTVGAESAPLTPGVTYQVGVRQQRGTGGNAILEAYVAPLGQPFGAPFAATSTGTWTTAANRVRLGNTAGAVANLLFDELHLDRAALYNGGGAPPPPPPPGPVVAPVARFDAGPVTGSAPLTVTFTDRSSGSPSTHSWDFGDGTTSTVVNPVKTYAAAGTYTATLTVQNEAGSDNAIQLIEVSTPPPVRTLLPVADAQVKLSSPNSNYGTDATLRVRADTYRSYLRFDVQGLTAAPASAKLRLFVTDGSPVGGTVSVTGTGWTEANLTAATAPAPGTVVGPLGPVVAGSWVELDVGSLVTTNGTVDLVITSSSTNSAIYSSRQGTNPPQLVLGTG
jgi:PKD repeat protein